MSNQQGVDLILALSIPVSAATGDPDCQRRDVRPQTMYAGAQEETRRFQRATVIQEVVRGYLGEIRSPREAQVICGSKTGEEVTTMSGTVD